MRHRPPLLSLSTIYLITTSLKIIHTHPTIQNPNPTLQNQNQLQQNSSSFIPTQILIILSLIDLTTRLIILTYLMLINIKRLNNLPNKILAALVIVIIICLRLVYLPLFFNTLPYYWVESLPKLLNIASFWFVGIFGNIITWGYLLSNISTSIRYNSNNNKKQGLLEPTIAIIIPILDQKTKIIGLINCIKSIINSNINKPKCHIILGFDSDSETKLYWELLIKLNIVNSDLEGLKQQREINLLMKNTGFSSSELFRFPPRLDIKVDGVKVTICRFQNSENNILAIQRHSLSLVNSLYNLDSCNTLVMLINNCDLILYYDTINLLSLELISNPNMCAISGLTGIRCNNTNNNDIKSRSILSQVYQTIININDSLENNFEYNLGSSTHLNNNCFIIRLSDFKKISYSYFNQRLTNSNNLTSNLVKLLLEGTPNWYIGYNSKAKVSISNDVETWFDYMWYYRDNMIIKLNSDYKLLSCPYLWRKLPLVILFKLLNLVLFNCRWLLILLIILISNQFGWNSCSWFILSLGTGIIIKQVYILFITCLNLPFKAILITPIFILLELLISNLLDLYGLLITMINNQRQDLPTVNNKPTWPMRSYDQLQQRQLSITRSINYINQLKRYKKAKISNNNTNNLSLELLNIELSELPSTTTTLNHHNEIIMTSLLFPNSVEIISGGDLLRTPVKYPTDISFVKGEEDEDCNKYYNFDNSLLVRSFSAGASCRPHTVMVTETVDNSNNNNVDDEFVVGYCLDDVNVNSNNSNSNRRISLPTNFDCMELMLLRGQVGDGFGGSWD